MAREDMLTGRKPLSGNSRSHSLNSTKRKWNLNLQKIKIANDQGRIFTIKVSTKTLKTLKKRNLLI